MNWYIIFANDNKINDLLLYFNNHPEMTAFVPKIEKLMKKDGKKVFAEVPMFPNYIFIESEFNSQEFYQIIESLEKDMDSTMRIMQSDEQKEKICILSKEEFINLNQTLLQEIDSCKFGVLIAMATGLRIGELCALKWKDISLKENYIYVNKTMQRIKNIYSDNPKTIIIEDSPKSSTSNRKIPIPANLITLFKQFRQNDDCYLLTGRSDKFVEPRSLERKFRKYIKNAGIEKANFHMLRHTFATMCIEGGFEIKCLSEILGHSGSQITLDRYVHSSFDLKKSWIDKFSNQNISCH